MPCCTQHIHSSFTTLFWAFFQYFFDFFNSEFCSFSLLPLRPFLLQDLFSVAWLVWHFFSWNSGSPGHIINCSIWFTTCPIIQYIFFYLYTTTGGRKFLVAFQQNINASIQFLMMHLSLNPIFPSMYNYHFSTMAVCDVGFVVIKNVIESYSFQSFS